MHGDALNKVLQFTYVSGPGVVVQLIDKTVVPAVDGRHRNRCPDFLSQERELLLSWGTALFSNRPCLVK